MEKVLAMKILQVNVVSDFGSTGRTVIEMAKVMENDGHEMFVAYGHGESSCDNSYKIGGVIENHLHNIGARITGKHGYGSKKGTLGLIEYIKDIQPDIIHLRTLHMYYINIELFFSFLSKYGKPVIWTLHDCWAYTGRCPHYTLIQCEKWKTKCSAPCPKANNYPASLFFDKTEEMFLDKKKWFTSIDKLQLVTVSHWLQSQVELSFFSGTPIQTIHNWIDHETFKPYKVCQQEYDNYLIPSNRKLVISVAGSWKGSKLEDALSLAKLLPKDCYLVLVGHMFSKVKTPCNIINVPYVNDVNKLASLYNMAGVYIHFSLEDTFGKVIAEAMSCGLPVLGYNLTAVPEIIGYDYKCGTTVTPRDIFQLHLELLKVLENGKEHYSHNSRARALKLFDMKKNIAMYERLYVKLYNENIKSAC